MVGACSRGDTVAIRRIEYHVTQGISLLNKRFANGDEEGSMDATICAVCFLAHMEVRMLYPLSLSLSLLPLRFPSPKLIDIHSNWY
jgi:hypothetical protein